MDRPINKTQQRQPYRMPPAGETPGADARPTVQQNQPPGGPAPNPYLQHRTQESNYNGPSTSTNQFATKPEPKPLSSRVKQESVKSSRPSSRGSTSQREKARQDTIGPYPGARNSVRDRSRSPDREVRQDAPRRTQQKSRLEDTPPPERKSPPRSERKSRWEDSPPPERGRKQSPPRYERQRDWARSSSRSPSPPPPEGGLFGGPQVDPTTYLQGLKSLKNQNPTPLDGPRISTVQVPRPKNTFDSGKYNTDCALASFASATNGRLSRDELESNYGDRHGTKMTATQEALPRLAGLTGMRKADSFQQLQSHLSGGGRAFVQAQQMEGENMHAYCAFQNGPGKSVIAYDPDTTQKHSECKKIPQQLIDPHNIYLGGK